MKVKLYCIYDSADKMFDFPRPATNEHDFVRQISIWVNDKTSQYNRYADYLSAYEVGEYDRMTGLIDAYTAPNRICFLKDLLQPEKENTPQQLLEAIQNLVGQVKR